MRTLYLRNVPDEVAAKLELMANRSGMSLNTFAVRELTATARQADNATLLDALADVDIDIDVIVGAIERERNER